MDGNLFDMEAEDNVLAIFDDDETEESTIFDTLLCNMIFFNND